MITCYLLCTELTASLPPGSDLLNWSYAGSKLPMNARSIQAGGTVLEGKNPFRNLVTYDDVGFVNESSYEKL